MQIIPVQLYEFGSPLLPSLDDEEKVLQQFLIFKVLFLFINAVRMAQPEHKDKFKSHFLCNSARFSKDLKCPIHQFCYLSA